MRISKANLIRVINENYSNHDISLMKRLNQGDGSFKITPEIKKHLEDAFLYCSDYKKVKLLPYFIRVSDNDYVDTNIGRIFGFGDGYESSKIVNDSIMMKDVNRIMKDILETTTDEHLIQLLEILESNDLISYGDLVKIKSPSDYFDTTQKNTKAYKDNFGWVVHQTRAFHSLMDIVVNGFKYGSSYDDLIVGGKNGDKTNGAYTFGYPINDYENHDIQYGTFFVLLKTNFIKAYHKKDDEQQAIFDTHKVQQIYPIVYDREFYYVVDNSGRIIFKNNEIINVANWLDTNSRQYSKSLDFRSGKIEEYKGTVIDEILGRGEPRHSGNDRYDKIKQQFKDKQSDKTAFM